MSHLLIKAVEKNDLDKVKEIVQSGVDLEYFVKNKTGRTALNEASLRGFLDIVRYLIEKGTAINTQDKVCGYTPLLWAIHEGHIGVVYFLLDNGADVNLGSLEYNETPLMFAVKYGTLGLVKKIINLGAHVEHISQKKENALAIAQIKNSVDAYERKNDKQGIIKLLKSYSTEVKKEKVIPLNWPKVNLPLAKEEYEVPEKVLRGFIESMYKWETEVFEENQENETNWDSMEKRYQLAFQPFCTKKERKDGRNGFSFGFPPEYHPSEKLISITHKSSSKVEIITRQNEKISNLDKERLYVILKKGGQYLVDSKKSRMFGSKKWTRDLL